MDEDKLRKEFNEFLDASSDEKIKEFLAFMKERRNKKTNESKEDENDKFKNRHN